MFCWRDTRAEVVVARVRVAVVSARGRISRWPNSGAGAKEKEKREEKVGLCQVGIPLHFYGGLNWI